MKENSRIVSEDASNDARNEAQLDSRKSRRQSIGMQNGRESLENDSGHSFRRLSLFSAGSHVTTEIVSNWLRIETASIQIVSAALFGRFSDTMTPKFAFVASIVVALLGHMIEALATKEATIASILMSDPLLGNPGPR